MNKLEDAKYFLKEHSWALIGLTSLASLIYFSKKFYFNGGSYTSRARLEGKTVIITGANTGIGKETALDLARRGARVILACRDLNKANEAANKIRKSTGNGNVLVEKLDLASLDSVRSFAQKILQQESRIDILINNAGIMACPQWKTKDGFEMQFGVNHLGHFLLTNLLLERMKQSAPSRIINVSALAYETGRIGDFDDLNSTKNYEPFLVYAKSKLCNILFTRHLAKRLNGTQVTVNALHPGIVITDLARHFSDSYGKILDVLQIVFYPIIFWFLKSARQGAQTTIYCAVDESVNNVTGCYFSDCKRKELLPHGLNEQDAEKLWQISEQLCNLNK